MDRIRIYYTLLNSLVLSCYDSYIDMSAESQRNLVTGNLIII